MQSLRFQIPRAARAFSTTPARPLAKMQLIGRLADVPELVNTSTGREIVKYAIGVSEGPRDEHGQRGVSWFKVASFQDGPQRDLLLSLPKGSHVYVEAEARMNTYETEAGKRTSLNLLQRNFEILQRPKNVEDTIAAEQAA
ncbi:Single-stranded DNA-binding protein [Cercospora zeina]